MLRVKRLKHLLKIRDEGTVNKKANVIYKSDALRHPDFHTLTVCLTH